MNQDKFQFDFKPEIRKQGEDLVAKNAVFLPAVGDVRVEGLVRGSQAAKVSLSSKSVSDPLLVAHCNCVKFAKGQFCKHIWSVMLAVDQKNPDFLEVKSEIQRAQVEDVAVKHETSKISEATTAAREAAKAKQSEYRKEQYAKQKARLKTQKIEKKEAVRAERSGAKTSTSVPSYSDEVKEALAFFSVNGFDFEYPVAIESLRSAKKILSRIFHPDKGGTHEEMLEMNRHFDVLVS